MLPYKNGGGSLAKESTGRIMMYIRVFLELCS